MPKQPKTVRLTKQQQKSARVRRKRIRLNRAAALTERLREEVRKSRSRMTVLESDYNAVIMDRETRIKQLEMMLSEPTSVEEFLRKIVREEIAVELQRRLNLN